MFCHNCGTELEDNALFCSNCGVKQESITPITPIKQKKLGFKLSKNKIIGIGVCAVVALGVFAIAPKALELVSPKLYLMNKVSNTFEDYSKDWEKTLDKIGVSEAIETYFEDNVHQSMQINVNNFGYIFDNATINLESQINLDKKEAASSISGQYGSANLGELQLYLKDDLIAIASPEYTNGQFYGLHTETIGQDLNNSVFANEIDIDPNLSFNAFDILETYYEPYKNIEDIISSKTKKEIINNTKDLLSTTEIKKSDRQNMNINGENVNLKLYTMSFDENEIGKYISNNIKAVVNDEKFYGYIKPILQMQYPNASESELLQYYQDEFNAENINPENYKLPLIVSIGIRDNGYIGLIEFRAYDNVFDIHIGTEDSLINKLTFTDGYESISISGNHELDDNTFNTGVYYNDSNIFKLDYSYKAKDENFYLYADGFSAVGTVLFKGKKVEANMSKISIDTYDFTGDISLNYTMQSGGKMMFNGKNATLINEMSTSDIRDLVSRIQNFSYNIF